MVIQTRHMIVTTRVTASNINGVDSGTNYIEARCRGGENGVDLILDLMSATDAREMAIALNAAADLVDEKDATG